MRSDRISPDYIGAQGPTKVFLGFNERGEPAYWDRSHMPHLLVSGRTGGGKGGAIQIIQAHDLTVGSETICIAPDPGEYGWLEGAAKVVDEDEAPAALDYVHAEMGRRRQVLAETYNPVTGTLGVAKHTDLPTPWRHLVLYVDETPAVLGSEAASYYRPEVAASMFNKAASIAKRGRKFAVHLVLATQYPTIEDTFGHRNGGGIKSQLGARIHFDRNTESLSAVFRNSQAIADNTVRFIETGGAGRGAYTNLDPDDRGQVSAIQVAWIAPSNLGRYVAAYSGPPPAQLEPTTKTFQPEAV